MSANRDFFGASSVTDFLGERYHVTLAYVVAKLATPSVCLDCHLSVCLSVCLLLCDTGALYAEV